MAQNYKRATNNLTYNNQGREKKNFDQNLVLKYLIQNTNGSIIINDRVTLHYIPVNIAPCIKFILEILVHKYSEYRINHRYV